MSDLFEPDVLDSLLRQWSRSLRARNRSGRTIETYTDTAEHLAAFAREHDHHPQRAGSRYPHRADACTDRHLRDRAPVLRCYGCAILAWAGAGGPQPRPSQQVRPGDR